MTWIEALILGLVQGLTEFLPVSSSGHLTIGQELLGLNTSAADNLSFIVAVHIATVLSTVTILWKEIAYLFKGTLCTLEWNKEKLYVSKILVATIPVFIVGMFFKDSVEGIFGSGLLVVGICLTVTAVLLSFAYFAKPRVKDDISFIDAFIIGLGQACAVLPGLSRSGTTIATGLILGNKKESIAQFSFLMVIIPILGQALLELIEIVKDPTIEGSTLGLVPMIIGFLAAYVSGCLACKFMINLVKNGKLIYFAIYCLLAGTITIVYTFF